MTLPRNKIGDKGQRYQAVDRRRSKLSAAQRRGIRMGRDGSYEFVHEHTECRNERCSLEINQGEEGFMTQSGTFCRWSCYLLWRKALGEGE